MCYRVVHMVRNPYVLGTELISFQYNSEIRSFSYTKILDAFSCSTDVN